MLTHQVLRQVLRRCQLLLQRLRLHQGVALLRPTLRHDKLLQLLKQHLRLLQVSLLRAGLRHVQLLQLCLRVHPRGPSWLLRVGLRRFQLLLDLLPLPSQESLPRRP